jgi:hypothetical protein
MSYYQNKRVIINSNNIFLIKSIDVYRPCFFYAKTQLIPAAIDQHYNLAPKSHHQKNH